MCSILVYLEDKNGERKALTNNKTTIGRSIQNTIVLSDLEVSRIHCYIKKTEDEWMLYDTSLNGTLINKSVRVNKSYLLQHGDLIVLSPNTEYKFINESNHMNDLSVIETTNTELQMDQIQAVTNENITSINLCAEDDGKSGPSTNEQETEASVIELDSLYDGNVIELDKDDSKIMETNDESFAQAKELTNTHIDQELTCSICTELFVKATTLNCSHTFCNHCILQWRRSHQDCPMCRKKITTQLSMFLLDNIIENMIQTSSDEVKKARNELIEGRKNLSENSSKPINDTGDESDLIEITDDEDDYDFDDSDCDSDWNMFDDDTFDETNFRVPYNGIPGRYYGGYGHCYKCSERGHWANGCPYKRHN